MRMKRTFYGIVCTQHTLLNKHVQPGIVQSPMNVHDDMKMDFSVSDPLVIREIRIQCNDTHDDTPFEGMDNITTREMHLE